MDDLSMVLGAKMVIYDSRPPARLRLLLAEPPLMPRDTDSLYFDICHSCDYALTGLTKRYAGRDYHHLVGTYGPFTESMYYRFDRPSGGVWGPPRPHMRAKILNGEPLEAIANDGFFPVWIGLSDDQPKTGLVGVDYSVIKHEGNIMHTCILVDALAEIKAKFGVES